MHLSGLGWFLGWIVMLPFGTFLYAWLTGLSIYNLVEIIIFFIGDFETWLAGPVRRAAVGWIIFLLNLGLSAVPGLNLITSPLFTWWALYDYFDYQFDPIFGERPARYDWAQKKDA